MAAGFTPALKDARMRFALPNGTTAPSGGAWPRDTLGVLPGTGFADETEWGGFVGAAGSRRLISAVTSRNRVLSCASSRYRSAFGRLLGSVIPEVSDGAEVFGADAFGAGTVTLEVWLFRFERHIRQYCRTHGEGAISSVSYVLKQA